MEFFETINARRSVRKFRQEAIPDDIITRLLEAIRTAPTAGNLQAYHVYLVQTPEMIKALAAAAFGQECDQDGACGVAGQDDIHLLCGEAAVVAGAAPSCGEAKVDVLHGPGDSVSRGPDGSSEETHPDACTA